jgi:phosphoribosylanthranilate isomerase
MIPVKICGITSVNDAQLAIENGASALGLIFYKPSLRNVSVEIAKEIVESVNGCVPIIGIFVDEHIQFLKSILSHVNLDILQLHGNETPQYCEQFNLPIIKVFRVRPEFDGSKLIDYNVSAFLFDTYKKGLPGGTGDSFDWELVSKLKIETPIILSGGLTPENIMRGIEVVNPSAVDVNSGVENCPGEKDAMKLAQLFSEINLTQGEDDFFKKLMVEI